MLRGNNKRRIGTGIQSMESRMMMAGDVSVSFNGSDLTITGDNAANRVDVTTVNGQIRVTGSNWHGSTSINGGQTPFTVNANSVDDIRIDMNGGNDRVFVNNVDLDNTTHGDLEIKTDSGDDLVGVYNSFARNVKVETGAHNDHAIVSFTDASRDISVDVGSGNDEIDLYFAAAADDIFLKGGTGVDDIAVQYSSTGDDLDVDLGDGADTLWMYQGDFFDVKVDADKGNDRVTLQSVNVLDDLDIHMGEGADKLYLYYTTVGDDVSLHGGSGSDYMSAIGNNFNAAANSSSF